MNFEIFAAGKPSLAYAKTGIAEYLKRLKRYGKVNLTYVKDGSSEAVSARLLEKSEGSIRVILDERGKSFTSKKFANQMLDWIEDPTVKKVSFLIGASDGHTDELRKKSDVLLNLSTLTLQHELALVVLLEQVYRGYTIIRGEPYHR